MRDERRPVRRFRSGWSTGHFGLAEVHRIGEVVVDVAVDDSTSRMAILAVLVEPW